jgi:hypothetical protein
VATERTSYRDTRQARKIRYTDAEWDAIVERARACGQPPARYVRDVSLGVVPKIGRAQANAPVVHELGRIGKALTALAAQERAQGRRPGPPR